MLGAFDMAGRLTFSIDWIYNQYRGTRANGTAAPGPRGEGFYAGYFRDLDGNKLNFFCYG